MLKAKALQRYIATVCGASALVMALTSAFAQQRYSGFAYVISAKPDAYGLHSVTINNVSRLGITAIHAIAICPEERTSESAGSDSLLEFYFLHRKTIPFYRPSLIAPGSSQQLDMPLYGSGCHQGVSVLFADGHGEGDEDPTYGWHQMIADRYASCAEMQRIREMIEAISDSDPHFAETLLQALEARHVMLNDPKLRDVPKSEVNRRSEMVDELRVNLLDPRQTSDDLKSRDAALKLLDAWMKPLQEHGYDKPAPQPY